MKSSPGKIPRLIAAVFIAIVASCMIAAGQATPGQSPAISQVAPVPAPSPVQSAPVPDSAPAATGSAVDTPAPASSVSPAVPVAAASPSPALTGSAPETSGTAPLTTGTTPVTTGTATPTPPSEYSIEIDLGKQRAYLLKSGHTFAESPISSGREGHLTPTGNFEIIQKDLNHFSNLYGKFVDIRSGDVVKSGADSAMPVPKGCKFVPAPMKWFMRFDGAAGMHAGILPGYAASHGCVRMPASKAELFYNTIAIGTPVHVFGTPPAHEVEAEAPTHHHPTPAVVAQKAAPPAKKHGWWIF